MNIPFRLRGLRPYHDDDLPRGRTRRRWRKRQIRDYLRLAEDTGAEPLDEPHVPEPDDWWDWDDELEWSLMESDYPAVWEDTVNVLIRR